jgi:hypothetical protein
VRSKATALDGAHAREAPRALGEAVDEGGGLADVVPGEAEVDGHECRRIDVEAGGEVRGAREAAKEEARAHEEHDGERDLSDHERLPQPAAARSGSRAASLVLEGGDEVGATGLESGGEAEEDSGHEREKDGEGEHPAVHAHVEVHRDGKGRDEAAQRGARPDREREAKPPAEHRHEDTLGQEVPHHARAARPEGEPHRDLAPPGGRAREHEVRDVRARDREHDPHDDHEQRGKPEDRRLRLGRHARLALPEKRESARRTGAVGPLVGVGRAQPGGEHVEARLYVRGLRAARQPGHERQEAGSPVAQRVVAGNEARAMGERQPGLDGDPAGEPGEALGGDPHDRERRAGEDERAAERRRIAGETPLPETVADHHRGGSVVAVVLRAEGAAERRPNGQGGEVVAGHELAPHARGLAVGEDDVRADAEGEGRERDDREAGAAAKRPRGHAEVLA